VAHPEAAERVLATAHKAKGLEWASVRLAADFPSLEELDATDQDGVPCLTAEERDQELHLLYVAATRARHRLEPNEAVRGCLATRPAAEGHGRAA
jgi:superfamily I DNA/RNA helicase